MTAHAAVLQLLQSVPNLRVHDGFVEVDEEEKVVHAQLPYAVLHTGLGRDVDERQGGRPGGRAVPIRVGFVGGTPAQALAVGERVRAALSRARVTVDGRESGLINLIDSDTLRRDDTYTRPGGEPLFYGADAYEVGI